MKSIESRILAFDKYCEILKNPHGIWVAGKYYRTTDMSELEKIGENRLGSHYARCNKVKLAKHIEFQEKLYLKLTGLPLETIYFPNTIKMCGKIIDENTIIPVTAYRLGYHYSVINDLLTLGSDSNRKTIVEIGGGWGAFAYILTNSIKNVAFVIIDIEQALINIGYVLEKYGKRICFCNEYDDINSVIHNTDIDVILALPNELKKLTQCDIVISAACMPELPKETIDYYVNICQQICIGYMYFDYTNECNGVYFEKKCNKINGFALQVDRLTPITCYMCPYKDDDSYGQREIITERLYKKI
jgi:hypothetical protein